MNHHHHPRRHDLAGLAIQHAWAVGILVGVSMLFSDVARLMISLAARRSSVPGLNRNDHTFVPCFDVLNGCLSSGTITSHGTPRIVDDVLAWPGSFSVLCPAARASRDSIPRGFSGQSWDILHAGARRAEF